MACLGSWDMGSTMPLPTVLARPDASRQPQEGMEALVQDPNVSPIRILVVDDQSRMHAALRDILAC